MAKIIIIMSVGSHQNATFGLAKYLVTCGHSVLYAGAEIGIYQEKLALNVFNQGFYYEILDPNHYDEQTDKDEELDDSTNRFFNFASNLLEGILFADFVKRTQPDLILLDVHLPIYAIAFFPFRIPVLFLSTELFTERNPIIPPLTSSIIPTFDEQSETDIEKEWQANAKHNQLSNGVKLIIEELSEMNEFPLQEYLVDKCIVLFGLKFPELILWPQEFEFGMDLGTLLNNKYYIGSWVDLERQEPDFDWAEIPPDRPLIYFALGTVVDHEYLLAFLDKLLAAFHQMPNHQFIISAGRLYEEVINKYNPTENIHIFQYVPQLTVLKKSDLMISLGGANSIKEAILCGVPLLCYPFHGDQFGNAARVVFHQLGLRGSMLKDSPNDIKQKIEKILFEGIFRESVAYFQKVFASYNLEHVHKIIDDSLYNRVIIAQ